MFLIENKKTTLVLLIDFLCLSKRTIKTTITKDKNQVYDLVK